MKSVKKVQVETPDLHFFYYPFKLETLYFIYLRFFQTKP